MLFAKKEHKIRENAFFYGPQVALILAYGFVTE